jgi:hypothetical protein
MRRRLEAAEKAQCSVVRVVDAADLEDRVGADLDAVALALAASAVDDRAPAPGRRSALLSGPIRMVRSPACLSRSRLGGTPFSRGRSHIQIYL